MTNDTEAKQHDLLYQFTQHTHTRCWRA